MFDLLVCYRYIELLDPLITPAVHKPSERSPIVLTEDEILKRRLHDLNNFIRLLDDSPNNMLRYRAAQAIHRVENRRKELNCT
jgi:hypothetical protein